MTAGTQRFAGSKIREARLGAGMSQMQLAYALKTSERNVRRWENDHNTPRADHIAAIAQATGRDIEFFYSDADQEVATSDPFHGSDGPPAASDRVKRRRGAGPAEVKAA